MMKELDIQALKAHQLEMLKIFINICEENGFKYFLIGGTCLGAVRHKGFIPWDDDIDVGMPREDYEKFAKISKDVLPGHLFFQTYETDPEYPNTFGKIRNSNTTYVETNVEHLNINHGVWIDIFPLDGISDNKIVCKVNEKIKIIYNFSISRVYKTSIELGTSTIKKLLLKFIYLLYPDIKKTIKKREKLYKKYPYSSSVQIANFGGAWGKKEIMPRGIFANGAKGVFEGVEVMLPEKYEEYLTRLYGDYMTPPPPEKRIGHHYYTVADMEKSYKEYREN